MKAIVSDQYGSPERLELADIDKPAVDDGGVLVRVSATSVNPFDWHLMRGLPYFIRLTSGLRRPKRTVLGVDLAGTVEKVGLNMTQFRAGDEVFGTCNGAFAEYVCGREQDFAPRPIGLTFEQAAAIPIAACTALQALRDRGRVEPGQRVLINGAAGGVGTFAVQIAKAFGADVTGVCSTSNLELVRSIGADQVIDYTAEDFTRSGRQYDLMLDTVGNRPLSELRRAMAPKGTLLLVGGGGGRLLGPATQLLAALVLSPFVSQRLLPVAARPTKHDLVVLKDLVEAGKITPVLDTVYPLTGAPDAIRHLETGHARGKIVITMQMPPVEGASPTEP
ncbi:MAG: NAD(P)-dependent alcohol dehydrogenase [Acidimicrobiales bacterium]|jgi:NADPH:quinone reductase-like Zn-dependent oxidoreductase